MCGGRSCVTLGVMRTRLHRHPVDHAVLRVTGQLILALALGALVLTACIVVLAGFDVLASPTTLGVVIALLAMWIAHTIALHRHRADQHLETIRARERRGF